MVNESLDSDPGLMVQGALRGLIGSGKILTRAVQRVRSTHTRFKCTRPKGGPPDCNPAELGLAHR